MAESVAGLRGRQEEKHGLGIVLLIVLMGLLVSVLFYTVVIRQWLSGMIWLPALPGGTASATAVFLLFSIIHSIYVLGWRLGLAFLAVSLSVSWLFEQIGVMGGWLFGPYSYTDGLGVKLGDVPVLVPIAWHMMFYSVYVVVNLIADGHPTGTRGSLLRVVWLSLVGSAIMVGWDATMEPSMSSLASDPLWVWEEGGIYFGVPGRNFVGWLITGFVVYFVYRMIEQRSKLKPLGEISPLIIAMVLVAYSTMFLGDLVVGLPEPLRVISPLVMGTPLLIAVGRFLDVKRS